MTVKILAPFEGKSSSDIITWWRPLSSRDTWLRTGYNYGFFQMSPGSHTEPHSDPLLGLLEPWENPWHANFFLGRLSTDSLYGRKVLDAEKDAARRFLMTSFYLENSRYSDQNDHYRSSLFHSLVMHGPDGKDRHYHRDKNVSHHHANGSVVVKTSYPWSSWVNSYGSYTFMGYDIPIATSFKHLFNGVEYPALAGVFTSDWIEFNRNTEQVKFPNHLWSGSFFGGEVVDAGLVLQSLLGREVKVTYRWSLTEWMDMTIKLSSYIQSPTGIDLKYSFSQSQNWIATGLIQINRTWDVECGYWLESDGSHFPISSDWRYACLNTHSYYNYSLREGWGINLSPGSSGFVDVPFSGTVSFPIQRSSYPISSPSHQLVSTLNQAIQDVRVVSDMHGEFWEKELTELRRSAVYSYHKALEAKLVTVKNNYIEVLNELPDLPGLVPDVKGFINLIKSVNWRSLASGVVKLGKLVASTNLQYNFGIAPTVGVVQELDTLGPAIGRRLLAASKTARSELKGQFIIDLPYSPPGFTDSRLITRTTCTLEEPDDPFWFAIMKLYSVRIAPSTRNIWEIIPMSFVVDWFTNMSGRFGSLDMSFLSIFVRASAIQHSYTVESTYDSTSPSRILTPFEALDWRFGKPSPVFYRRELSRTVPILSDGKIDYLSAAGNPDLGIFTSLVATLTVP